MDLDWDWNTGPDLTGTIPASYDHVLDLLESDIFSGEVRAAPRDFGVGTNLAWYAGAGDSDPLIFVNQIKAATGWYAPSAQDIPLALDENGYVTALPDGKAVTSTVLNRSPALAGIEPFSGEFRLYGQGTGELTGSQFSNGDLFRRIDTGALPTEEIDGETYWYIDFSYVPQREGIAGTRLTISDMEESAYIRDLALVHHSHLDEFRAGEIFAPEFIDDLAPYETLRFLDWTKGTRYEHDADWNAIDPERRYIGTDHFNFNTALGIRSTLPRENYFLSNAPFEYIIELANETDSNAWINLPVDITDARVEWMADYAAAHLEDGLQIYWEYGNEVYSSATGFEGSRYAELMAEATFGIEGWQGIVEWAAYRGPQLFEIIRDSSEEAADLSRFVSAVWGFQVPTDGEDSVNTWSYAYRYFEAAAAQSMADAPPAPADIITDYAHGLYFGGSLQQGSRDAAVAEYILEAYADDTARAEALARWLLFGADPSRAVDVTPEALTAPVTGVSTAPGQSISVSALIRADIEAGLDPLRDLGSVLRLEGDTLYYRGVSAPDWVAVLRFDGVPAKTLEEMIADVEIMGYGARIFGEWQTGLYSGLAQQAELTLSGHKPFVESLGLTWLGYEGGPHLYKAPEGGEGMFKTFRDDGYATLVQAVWFDLIDAYGVDGYVHYMAHGRYADENPWGALAYVGQDPAEAPKASYLYDTIIFSEQAEGREALVREYTPVPDAVTLTPASWQPPDPLLVQSYGDIGSGGEVWGLASGATLVVETARDLSAAPALTLSIDLLSALNTAGGTLTLAIYAAGGGSDLLLRETLSSPSEGPLRFDLGALPENRDMIRVVISWSGPAPLVLGAPVLSGLALSGAEMPVELGIASQQTGWIGKSGTETGPAGFTLPVPAGDKLILETGRDLPADGEYLLRLVPGWEGNIPPGGALQVVVFAVGGGSEELLRSEIPLDVARPQILSLGSLPEERDMLRIKLRWIGTSDIPLELEMPELFVSPVTPLAASPVAGPA